MDSKDSRCRTCTTKLCYFCSYKRNNSTIKSYTDLSQSKRLAEILPLESADMCYSNDGTAIKIDANSYTVRYSMWKDCVAEIIPCWSLAALLDVLPTLNGRNAVLCKDIRYDEWHICYHSTATLSIIDTERYDNPVDACYEMIIKLHELNLL